MIWSKPFKTLNIIEISRQAILKNYDSFVSKYPQVRIWPVLKSNAYGHGLKQIATILRARSPDFLIVDSYYEALEVRKYNPSPILLIGSTHPQNFPHIKLKNISLCVQDLYSLKKLSLLKKPVSIHLKINTGMNRQGIDRHQLPLCLQIIADSPQINFQGVFSHLADADNPQDKFTPVQLSRFRQIINQIRSAGFYPAFFHLASTFSAAKVRDNRINALRLGLGLYTNSLRFLSTIINCRLIKPGDSVGYNRTFTAKKAVNIGLIPVGYFEGLDRRLSNCGFVKYQNQFFPIAGRVCMNLACVNFNQTQPPLFAPVEIISPNPKDKNSIKNIAKTCDTIPYEILTRLHSSIRRVII